MKLFLYIFCFLYLFTPLYLHAQLSNPDAKRNHETAVVVGVMHYKEGNYGKALKRFKEALAIQNNDSALYFAYLSKNKLQHDVTAGYFAKKLSSQYKDRKGLKSLAFKTLKTTGRPEFTDNPVRGSRFFRQVSLETRLSWRLTHEFSASYYRQIINEMFLGKELLSPDKIHVNQTSYYNKLSFALTHDVALVGAYNYQLKTFNNRSFENQSAMMGVQYFGNSINLQADVMLNRVFSSSFNQYNVAATWFPNGSNTLKLGFRTALQSLGNDNKMFLEENVAVKVSPHVWIEAESIFTPYQTYITKDASYIENSFDRTKFKAGLGFRFAGSKTEIGLMGLLEQRQLYNSTNRYHVFAVNATAAYKFNY